MHMSRRTSLNTIGHLILLIRGVGEARSGEVSFESSVVVSDWCGDVDLLTILLANLRAGLYV